MDVRNKHCMRMTFFVIIACVAMCIALAYTAVSQLTGWDSKVLAKRGRVALAALSGMPISPCKGCGDACCGSCRRKDVYDDLMRDYC